MNWNTGSTSAVKWNQSWKDVKKRVHFLVVRGFSNLEVNMYRKDGNFRKITPGFSAFLHEIDVTVFFI